MYRYPERRRTSDGKERHYIDPYSEENGRDTKTERQHSLSLL
jgi:hypothetical protein